MRALLDTSVLIGELPPPGDVEAAISVASITELHFGVLVAVDDDERARRSARLSVIEATFDPLPLSVEVARAWGQLATAVARRGGNPRRRQIDLAIAATARVEGAPSSPRTSVTSRSSMISSTLGDSPIGSFPPPDAERDAGDRSNASSRPDLS